MPEFKLAVAAVITAIDTHDGDVLVHCQAGISRSSMVLITALAEIDDTCFDDAYNEVYNAKPSIAPHPALRELALEYLGEDGSPYKNPFQDK
jgi:atypical dual specificity phosphatase